MAKMVDYILYDGSNWKDVKRFWNVEPSNNLLLCTTNAPVGWYLIKTDDDRYGWIPPRDLELIKARDNNIG